LPVYSHAALPSERDDNMNIAQKFRNQGENIGFSKGQREGIQKGREEGIEANQTYVVQRMLKMGLSENEISKYTDLSVETIQAIKNKHERL
jgi:predicted transposase/invertase (TIGR01784 family)